MPCCPHVCPQPVHGSGEDREVENLPRLGRRDNHVRKRTFSSSACRLAIVHRRSKIVGSALIGATPPTGLTLLPGARIVDRACLRPLSHAHGPGPGSSGSRSSLGLPIAVASATASPTPGASRRSCAGRAPATYGEPREQAHLPAEQPSPRQDARLPPSHAHPRRSRHPRRPPPQGPRRALCLSRRRPRRAAGTSPTA